ncbi:MAG: 16S rRNA (cytosine(1402)-N(4))-methyltransferase RsmH [Candidatus Daviesbacteria bacterium]|nr:16S rRNA (cytosine(1402)-N(4))-methyltransferase RsmH [Candidatus Daviesbacteria bacterium]
MSSFHNPVMLKETMHFLDIKKGGWYVDCNLGGGGHTKEILKMGGKVIGIDLDIDAIKEVAKNHNLNIDLVDNHFQAVSENLILIQSNFSNIQTICSTFLHEISPQGILFDLGVSSYQLETAQRGFSFQSNGPLDMRMDRSQQISAADLVNGLYEKELAELLWKYGEESFSKPIARKIIEYRSQKKIETIDELVKIILSVKHTNKIKQIHPATKVFQALRIAVNDELNNLKGVLPKTLEVLQPGGRLVVISFHSLEDRIVKNFMKDEEEKCSVKIITQKPISSSEEEIQKNSRSRSAKLRVAEKF